MRILSALAMMIAVSACTKPIHERPSPSIGELAAKVDGSSAVWSCNRKMNEKSDVYLVATLLMSKASDKDTYKLALDRVHATVSGSDLTQSRASLALTSATVTEEGDLMLVEFAQTGLGKYDLVHHRLLLNAPELGIHNLTLRCQIF